MFNVGIISSRGTPHPIGETILLSSGIWVCPQNVRRVSAVLVGQGGFGIQYPSSNRGSGGGGALVYANDIAVTPGAEYSYAISAAGTTIFGLNAAAGSSGTSSGPGAGGIATTTPPATAGFDGGFGVRPSSLADVALGGSAATYTSAGLAGRRVGIQLYGIDVNVGQHYGAGGNAVYSSGSTSPQGGAIRIIWGQGRSFPDNAA